MIGREQFLDYGKGIGIILVVFEHVVRGLYSAKIENDFYPFYLIDELIYSFHMPLFFFISGYLLSLKKPFLLFLKNKSFVIVYVYYLWGFLQLSIEFFMSRYTNGSVSYFDFLEFVFAPRAQFWFLYALFVFFIVSFFVFRNKLFLMFSLFFFFVFYFFFFFESKFLSFFSIFYVFFFAGYCC